MADEQKLRDFALELFKIGVLKFGDFKMKVGINSPVYCDLRVIISYPKLLDTLADLLCEYSQKLEFSQLCGVPYTALPIATLMSTKLNTPMLVRRKEQKAYGTKKLIEGVITPGDKCLIVEDVVTTGSSILETVTDLRKEKLDVTETIVVLDREQGGVENLAEKGITMHSLYTMTSLLRFLFEGKCIDQATVDSVKAYIQKAQIRANGEMKNGCAQPKQRTEIKFEDRIKHAQNPIAKRLFQIMSSKQTNLCVAADVTDAQKLLEIAEAVGPSICLLKTHVDILTNYTPALQSQLKQVAERMNFVILEDRKFADIGNTVKLQYSRGVYEIGSWADTVTVHSLPGPGVLTAIKEAVENNERGVFLLAEMSSADNLITNSYSKETMRLADTHKDIICGIVCQSKDLVSHPGMIQLTPGVKLNTTKDALGQQYNTPETVILENGADIAVVGRGIIEAKNIVQAAEEYKTKLWSAYEKRISGQ